MPEFPRPFKQDLLAPAAPESALKASVSAESEDDERGGSEREDFEYKKVIEAVDGLHAMATQQQVVLEVIERHREAISVGIRVLQDRLLDRKTMGATMPVVLKLKEIIELYRKKDEYFDEDDKLGIHGASVKADILLEQAMHSELNTGGKEEPQESFKDIVQTIDSFFTALSQNEPLENFAPILTAIALHQKDWRVALKERPAFLKVLPRLIQLAELGDGKNAIRLPQMSRFVFDLITENVPQLLDEIRLSDASSREQASEALNLVVFNGAQHQTMEGIRLLEEKEQELLASPDEETVEEINARFFQNHFYRSKVVTLWAELVSKDGLDREGIVNKAGMKYMEQVSGMDGFSLFSHWINAAGGFNSLAHVASENFNRMQDLEEEEKGITKFLNEKFGIYNFGRYPREMLLKQYRERENTEIPYGVVFFPYDDHNGAFFNDREILASLDAQLTDKYLIRLAEGGTKFDIVRRLHHLKRTYGKTHKISFAIIGGHGTTESINFGGWGKRNKLHEMDLADTRARDTKDYFEEDATLILFSCSTGFKNGIGQKISRRLHLRVIAPEKPASPESISASVTDKGVSFSVKFKDATGKEYARGEEVQTQDGEF